MNNTRNQIAALRIIGENTRGYFNITELSGPRFAKLRAEIMSLLVGRKVSQSQSGVNALEKAAYGLFPLSPGCPAAQQEEFSKLAKEQLNQLQAA